MSNSPMEN